MYLLETGRVLSLHHARAAVPRIDQWRLATLLLLLVESIERRPRPVELPTNLELAALHTPELVRHGTDLLHLLGDHVAASTVAARDRALELPADIGERHGNPIDLGLDQ